MNQDLMQIKKEGKQGHCHHNKLCPWRTYMPNHQWLPW